MSGHETRNEENGEGGIGGDESAILSGVDIGDGFRMTRGDEMR